ncbi:MAG: tRNA (adenosine(37)-N6)-threonylcarbamoyltransferase complex dimerization subunit type 1 TsaB [Chloroflexi bacterium]|nr:tRNA (adenosine(37)-N6)-threonylcarbamoyltransferase complex dimerization subunit type 1 TsaB [Chloroflexota bacterium]
MLLAIDTSTRYAGVALLDDSRLLVQLLHWRSRQNHSVELLPSIETVLNRQQVTIQDITAIAIATGPGAFSALRVGLSTAKGLAWANDIPLVTATTLETEAFSYRSSTVPICAVMEAGRGQIAWALFEDFEGSDAGLHQTSAEAIAAPEDLLRSLPSPALICGEALEQHADALSTDAPSGVRLALPYLPGQRVATLAHMGHARLELGLCQDPTTLEPLYLRRPTITEPRHR